MLIVEVIYALMHICFQSQVSYFLVFIRLVEALVHLYSRGFLVAQNWLAELAQLRLVLMNALLATSTLGLL